MSEAITPSTLTLSNSTVNPGNSVVATISMASSELSHKITFSLGSKTHSHTLSAGVSTYTYTIPSAWASQLSGTSGTISVKLITYNNGTKVGTDTYSLKLVIPDTDTYKPTFDLVVTRNNNNVPSAWGEYVQGVSTVTVEPQNIQYKNGATVGSVMIKVGKITKTEIPATFDLPNAGAITVKVTVKDSRGLTTIKTHVLTVREYSPPSVDIKSLCRCLSNGTTDSFGTCGRIEFDYACSSVNAKNSCTVTIRYGAISSSIYTGSVSTKQSPYIFGAGTLDITATYKVSVLIEDSITTEGVELIRYISSANIPFNIRRGGSGAAFGKFAESDNLLDVNWDMNVNGNLTLGGEMNFTKLTVTCTEKAEDIHGFVRYYPWLKMVYLRIRLTAATGLSATDTHYLAQINEVVPAITTPVSSVTGTNSGGQSIGSVLSKTGYVTLRTDTPVTAGTYIYISGWFPADTIN